MITRLLTAVSITSFCLLLLLLITTNPTTSGPAAILAVIILTYLSLLGVVTFLLYGAVRFMRFLVGFFSGRPVRWSLSVRRAYFYATILATLPMMAVGMNAVGGIQWYELLLLGIFGFIGVVYIARRA